MGEWDMNIPCSKMEFSSSMSVLALVELVVALLEEVLENPRRP